MFCSDTHVRTQQAWKQMLAVILFGLNYVKCCFNALVKMIQLEFR